MDRDAVMRWVAGYERAWRTGDTAAVESLFTADVEYRLSPYGPVRSSAGEVRGIWRDDVGRRFTMRAEPVAVDGSVAVVRVDVRYEDPQVQEYRDLWLLRFATDGRVEDFEEWAYWPDRPHTAAQD